MAARRVARAARLATLALLCASWVFAQDAGRRRQYAGADEEALLAGLRRAEITRIAPVGHTSVNFHARLTGTTDGAFKPAEARHRSHYLAEIAAFELNRLLGLERVPPAVFRRVPLASLPGAADAGVIVEDGVVRGAMIHWVPVLRHVGINATHAVERWTAQLTVGGEIPERERARAEEISTLLVFDYLIGNWDRWRGTNTMVDGRGRLVYRDNNGGFYEPYEDRRHEAVLEWLERTEKFSRRLVARARALTFDALRAAVTVEGHGPLLTDAQVRGVLRRRDALLSYVAGLVALYGEREVLAFE